MTATVRDIITQSPYPLTASAIETRLARQTGYPDAVCERLVRLELTELMQEGAVVECGDSVLTGQVLYWRES